MFLNKGDTRWKKIGNTQKKNIWTATIIDPKRSIGAKSKVIFNPVDIRVTRRSMTLDLLIRRLKYGELDLYPDFQREPGIWDDGAQSRLIESLIIRLPIPAFYFDATDDAKWLVY